MFLSVATEEQSAPDDLLLNPHSLSVENGEGFPSSTTDSIWPVFTAA